MGYKAKKSENKFGKQEFNSYICSMLKTYKYRLYPTIEQQKELSKIFGCCRLVYNLALETKLSVYEWYKVNLNKYDLTMQLPDLKDGFEWLNKVPSQAYQMQIRNLFEAFDKFWIKHEQNKTKSLDQKYRKKYVRKYNSGELKVLCLEHEKGYPKFKSKYDKQSFQLPQSVKVNLIKGHLILPKFNSPIKAILHRKFVGKIKTVTISKTTTGKYFVSILVDNPKQEIPTKVTIREENAIGIDLNIKELVTSDNERFENPRFLRDYLIRLGILQKRLKKRKQGSKRYNKLKKQIANLHEQIANKREYFAHKTSKQLVNNHDTLIFEDLNIVGMAATCKPVQDENGRYLHNGQSRKSGLNRSINDACWGKLLIFTKYKADWTGKNFEQIGRYEPSSKECNACGEINEELTLKDRTWTCKKCNTLHDRDYNAAKNIKKFFFKHITAGTQDEDVEMLQLTGSAKRQISNDINTETNG